ncbi:hypothetical protein OSTOST_25442 [Ostertagia ostertagi]
MGKILQTHPKAVQAHKDIVLRCLDDKDESIRIRSLDLLYGMVSKKNIMEIVKKLMEHVESAEGSHYRYISVLVELTKVEADNETWGENRLKQWGQLHRLLNWIALKMHILLAGSAQQRSNICEVLLAAAWICGEYSHTLLSKAEKEDDWDAIESLDNLMLSKLADFELAEHLEAQERVRIVLDCVRVK